MDCITLLACIYLDIAVGGHRTTERQMMFADSSGVESVFTTDEIPLGNPLGKIAVGIELPHGFSVEFEHFSSLKDATDRGFNGLWIKKRFSFASGK